MTSDEHPATRGTTTGERDPMEAGEAGKDFTMWSTVIRECARTDDVFAVIGAALFFVGLAGMAVMG